MKKRYGWQLFFLGLMLFALWSGKRVEAATADISLTNFGTVEVTINQGDDGMLRPSVENLVDVTGQPVTVTSWSYNVYDEEVLTVDETGHYRALSAGTTTVSVRGYDQYYSLMFAATCRFTISVDMTNVTLEKTSIKAYVCGYEGVSEQIRLLDPDGVNAGTTDVSLQSSNAAMAVNCTLENNMLQISTYSTGTTVLTVTINGKVFTIHLSVSSLEITKRSYVTSKGKKVQLRVKGTSDQPVWSSSNSKVAKVSKKGLVRFRKNGNAVITADFNGKRVGCAVSVISPKLLKVVNRAKKIGTTWKYSQPKRMQKGYYDCSSLVWKSYSLMGKKFGMANYAPVAADLAKWCASHGKVLTKSYTRSQIQKMKFRPGDLMFETGQDNHRYKGIYHVEMFTGYAVAYYDETGKPVLNELWAARPEGYYGGGGLMERP